VAIASDAGTALAESTQRVRYRERQVLRVSDLRDEQAYLIAARRRHDISQHRWGIVSGLRVQVVADGVEVSPGVALDGFGRMLVVSRPIVASLDAVDQPSITRVAVWLEYDRVDGAGTESHEPCGSRLSRSFEQPRMLLSALEAGDTVDPRAPVLVDPADLEFEPFADSPDDPGRQWPVFLGLLERPSNSQGAFTVDEADRPQIKLVGEQILAPSGRARVQVGAESGADSNRFVVAIQDSAGKLIDRLSIDRFGHTRIRPGTRVTASQHRVTIARAGAPRTIAIRAVRLTGCGTAFDDEEHPSVWGVAFRPVKETPKVARPWTIYRTKVLPTGTPPSGPTLEQLRFEIGHPGKKGDPTRYRLVVGHRDNAGAFQKSLTVDANGNVTVHKHLNVLGRIKPSPIDVNVNDPRFQIELLARWTQGVTSSTRAIGTYYSGKVEPSLAGPDEIDFGETLQYSIVAPNTGAVPIDEVSITEFRANSVRQIEIPESERTLPVGVTREYPQTFDPPASGVLNIDVVVEGRGPGGYAVSGLVSKSVLVRELGEIEIEWLGPTAPSLSEGPVLPQVGEQVTYEFRVRNTGNVAIEQIAVTAIFSRPHTVELDEQIGDIAAYTQSSVIPVSHTATSPGSMHVRIVAIGTGPGKGAVQATLDRHLTVIANA
jgi:uncharacterized repeat protein (TIGR01451 family)